MHTFIAAAPCMYAHGGVGKGRSSTCQMLVPRARTCLQLAKFNVAALIALVPIELDSIPKLLPLGCCQRLLMLICMCSASAVAFNALTQAEADRACYHSPNHAAGGCSCNCVGLGELHGLCPAPSSIWHLPPAVPCCSSVALGCGTSLGSKTFVSPVPLVCCCCTGGLPAGRCRACQTERQGLQHA